MKRLVQEKLFTAILYFIMASCTRSNGLVNVAFIAYYALAHALTNPTPLYKSLLQLVATLAYALAILVPFAAVNLYAYNQHCTGTSDTETPAWCHRSPLPLVYSHVQENHWKLGAFAYYRLRKTPNFLLATPLVCLVGAGSFHYMRARGLGELKHLGLATTSSVAARASGLMAFTGRNLFCYVVHANFLVGFALVFMHVEVVTRLLMSSSPLPYWIAASLLLGDLERRDASAVSAWAFLADLRATPARLVAAYFLGYFLVGTLLHANFLPWT